MSSRIDTELETLNTELIKMGALCEDAIGAATNALLSADTRLAAKIPPVERAIDVKEREIEDLCMRLILRHQPVARDLRKISAALKMITDMERIGDQARDIGEMIKYLGDRRPDEFRIVGDMADAACVMVSRSVDAFVKKDVATAREVILSDDYVDSRFDEIKKSLINMINRRLEDGEYAVDLLMTAKYFERIADHAVNVAEWVVYSITGEHKEADAE